MAGTSLGRLVIDLAANAAGFESDMKRASKAAQNEMRKVSRELRFAQRDLDAANAKLSTMATRIGALGAVSLAVVAREFRKLGDEADRIQKLGIATGLSAEAIQELGFAAEQSGSNLESVVKGVQQLQRNIVQAQDGLATYTRAFERVGIAAEDLQGLSPEEQFLRMAQALSQVEDPTVRTATAMKLLGRAGRDLIPFLAQGADGIEELREQLRSTGSVMSQDTVNAAARFNDAINLLTRQAEALKVALFSDIIEPLADLVDFLARTEEGQEALRETMGRLANIAKVLGAAIGVTLVASFARATLAVIQQNVRVATLTAQKLALAGATTTAARSMAAFGAAVRIATGPIGIIVTALGSLALGYREITNLAAAARNESALLGQETETLSQRVRRLTGDFQSLRREQLAAAQKDIAIRQREIRREFEKIRRAIQEEFRAQQESGFFGGKNFWTLDLIDMRSQLEALKEEFEENEKLANELGKALDSLGKESDKAGVKINRTTVGVDALTESFRSFAQQRSAREMADAISAMNDEIADASARLGGPLAQNLRNFQREVQRVASLPIPEALKAERIELLRQEYERVNIEIRDGLIRTFEDAAQVTREAANEFRAFGAIGANFATSLLQGGGIRDSLSRATIGFASQEIGSFLDEELPKFVETAFKDGIGAALEDADFQRNSAAGFALALGRAVEGDSAAAAGTAIGNAIAGPIGAIAGGFIGKIIGGLFSNNTPRFELFSLPGGSNLKPGRSDFFSTIFGEQAVRFRDFSDEAEAEYIRAFQQLDRTVASILPASLRRAIDQSSFEFDSRVGDANIDDIFEERVGFFIDQLFDSAIAGFIRGAGDIDTQIQRIADVLAIENQLLLGRGFGLSGPAASPVDPGGFLPAPPGFGGGGGGGGPIEPVPDLRPLAQEVQQFQFVIQGTGDATSITNDSLLATLQLLEELAFGTESLQETFARLTTVVDSLDRVIGLTGNNIADSREGLVRFGAELVEIFGNDAQAFAAQLDRALGAIFTDEELLNQAVAQSRQQIANLLGSIGVEVTEAVFTAEGFREVFESLFGSVGPEETAVLIEAGATLADLIEAEERLAAIRVDAADEIEGMSEDVLALADSLGRTFDLLGTSFNRAGQELAEFSAELLAVFDDDLNRLTGQLSRALGAIFSDEELLSQVVAQSRQQIADLLGSIGVEVTEAAFTAEGFREIFEDLFGSVGPEDTAALIEAGAALADLIEAEEQLANIREAAVESVEELRDFERSIDDKIFEALADDFRIAARDIEREFQSLTKRAGELGASQQTLDQIERLRVIRLNELTAAVRASIEDLTQLLFGDTNQQVQQVNRVSDARNAAFKKELRALERISDFLDSVLLSGVSPLTPGERVREAREQLEDAFRLAEMGDLAALENLPRVADQFFREFQQFTGGVGDFPGEFDDIIRRLQALQDAGPQNQPSSIRPPSALDFQSGIRRLTNELTELQRVASTFTLVDQIALLSQLTSRQPSDIAAELGIPINEVIQTLTGEVPGLIGDDLEVFFDDLVFEANRQLSELNTLESLATSRNSLLRDILDELGGSSGQTGQPEEPPQIIPPIVGPYPPGWPGFATGGPVNTTGPAIVHSGEFVVPRNGVLVSKGGDRAELKAIADKLDRIERVLAEGNSGQREQTGVLQRLPDELSRAPFLASPSRGIR